MVRNVDFDHYLRSWTAGQLPYVWTDLSSIIDYNPLFVPLDTMSMGMQERQKVRIRSMKIQSAYSCHTKPAATMMTVMIITPKQPRGAITNLEPDSIDHFDFLESKDWITNRTIATPTRPIDDIFNINTALWKVHKAKRFILGAKPVVDPSPGAESGGVGRSAVYYTWKLNLNMALKTRTTTLSWKDTHIDQLPFYQRYFMIMFSSNHHAATDVDAKTPKSHHVISLQVSST